MSGVAADDHAFAITRIFPRLGLVTDTRGVLAALPADPA